MNPVSQTLDEYLQLFRKHGGTDEPYLIHHYQRFTTTLNEFSSSWTAALGVRTLDIGAHWLHQSALWTLAGFQVTAVDMPITFEMPHVKSLAAERGIRLVPTSNLEVAQEFDAFEDSSFDVILFTEIFEHLTFNPVSFWKQVHRVIRPGGRIVITTPNYYAWNGRAWNFMRFVTGDGGGISVDEILKTNTHAHHWREYSLRELSRYFSVLSPDFNITKAKRVQNYYPRSTSRQKRIGQYLIELVPPFRPNLHVEVELTSKDKGIVVEPGW